MNAQDALRTQFQLFFMTTGRNLEGMTEEDSLVQPEPSGNCANWILGHIVGAQNGVMALVGQDPVWEDESLKRAGNDPITGPDEAIDWNAMVENLLESEGRLLDAIDGLTDAQLDEGGFTDPFGQPTTRGAFLGLLAMHQNYHAGQLAMARRFAGLPGAIRGPDR